MKIAIAAAVACLLAGAAQAAGPEQKLLDIETAWTKAYVARDTAAVGSYLADEWTGQSDGPKPISKSAFLADIKSGKLGYTAIRLRDMKVRVFGTAAVVQGFDDETSHYGKEDTSGAYSWIDVFVERGGKWVVVASQITKVKK